METIDLTPMLTSRVRITVRDKSYEVDTDLPMATLVPLSDWRQAYAVYAQSPNHGTTFDLTPGHKLIAGILGEDEGVVESWGFPAVMRLALLFLAPYHAMANSAFPSSSPLSESDDISKEASPSPSSSVAGNSSLPLPK